ncbi:MAG: universal stress protein [Candidatus Lokiarchaeia archaeon]
MSLHGRIDEFERLEEKLKHSLKRTVSIKPIKFESIILYFGTNENHRLCLDLCKAIAKRHKCKVKLVCDARIFGEKTNQTGISCDELFSETCGELESVKISEVEKHVINGEVTLEEKLSEIIEKPSELIIIPATPMLNNNAICSTNKSIEQILEKLSNPILLVKKNEQIENLKALKNVLITFSDVSDLDEIISTTLAIADKKAKINILSVMDDRFLNYVEMIMGAISDESRITKEEIIESVMKQIKKILNETTTKIAEMGYKVDYLMETGETVHRISDIAEKIKASLIVVMHRFEHEMEAEVKLILEEINVPVLIISQKE